MKRKRVTVYRLFVGLLTKEGQRIDPGAVEYSIRSRIRGGTIYKTLGFWEGRSENSLVLEIVSDGTQKKAREILDLAETLKRIFSQETVWIEYRKGFLHEA